MSLSLTWLSSCSDDNDDPADDGAPVISFSNLADDATVWNTVSATVDVDDDLGIEKLEVYVDGTLLTTITEEPFEIEWNSNTVSDGQHVIKVVATDTSGNTASKEVTVTVKNILLSFDVADDQLVVGETAEDTQFGVIFLSDDDGNVIASAEYENGDHIELRSSTFNGETFTVTEGILNDGDYYPIGMWTYPQVERGTWKVYHAAHEDDYAGDASLDFSNAAVDSEYRFVTNGMSTSTIAQSATFSTSVELSKSPSKLLVMKESSTPDAANTYRLFPSITIGDNATINLSQVNQAMTKTSIDVPQGADYLEVDLHGYPVAGDYTEQYRIGSFTTDVSKLILQHPGDAFPSYYSETYYNTDDYRFISGRTNALYNLTPLQFTATFSISDGMLKCSSTGTFDFLYTDFYSELEELTVLRWVFVMPVGNNQSVAFPQLSEAFTTLMTPHFATFDFDDFMPEFSLSDEYGVVDYEVVDGYSGLKSYIREYGVQGLSEHPVNFTEMQARDNSDGRISSKAKTKNKRARRAW